MELYVREGFAYGTINRLDYTNAMPKDIAASREAYENESPENQRHIERKILSERLSIPRKKIILLDQVHGNTVIDFDNHEGDGDFGETSPLFATGDAVFARLDKSEEPNVLAIRTADCVAVVGYHPDHNVYFGIHAGWKGCANGIATRTISQIHQAVAPDMELAEFMSGIQFIFGPHRRRDYYEVGEEFKDIFAEKHLLKRNGALYLSMLDTLRDTLTADGAKWNHFRDNGWCTGRHSEFFYSHRAGHKGRNLTFIYPLPQPD